MPWKENSVLDSRLQFIATYQQDIMSFSELCRQFGITRPTGYKFVSRYRECGPGGLQDLSKAAHCHPNAIDEQTQSLIVDLRTRHPNWGPAKLRVVLMREHPQIHPPAASTIGQLLKSRGLVSSRRRSRSCAAAPYDLSAPDRPNAVWTADFKGQFKLKDGSICYPLTICDAHSRMILRCQALPNTATDPAKAVWVAAFREHGLPSVIRTDNGAPFASIGIGGISRLSAWWIRLGVLPERIAPGKPQQNGSHERMHKTLKQEITSTPQADLKSQQKAFSDFTDEYNYIRPHQALDQQVPASIYEPSPREYPLILSALEYPACMTTRYVRTTGEIRWRGGLIFVSEILTGEHVALDPLDDRHFALYYGPVPLGILDDHTRSWLPTKKAAPKLKQLRKEASVSP